MLRIERLAAGGDGVARDADGRVVFVPLTAPGDLVRVRTVERRKRFARAELVELVESGPDRTPPPCPLFGRCGGCSWQHLAYPAQLEAKRAIVEDALARIGGFELSEAIPILPSPEPYGYRVRARLVQQGKRLGYRMRRSHAVIETDRCPVLDPRLEPVLGRPREEWRGAPGEASGARGSAEPPEWEVAVGSDGAVRSARTGRAGASVDQQVGADRLRVSHGVFAQANGLLCEALAHAVVSAAPEAGTVSCLELYAGGGLFTLGLSRRFDQVWAIESHPGAVADLRENLARAGRDNVRVHPGRVERVLSRLELARPDLLVLDPPRSGVDPEALAAVIATSPRHIAYLSCDPATLARDLKGLRDAGYRLDSVRAFDLFPQTPHVEVLTTLSAPGAPPGSSPPGS